MLLDYAKKSKIPGRSLDKLPKDIDDLFNIECYSAKVTTNEIESKILALWKLQMSKNMIRKRKPRQYHREPHSSCNSGQKRILNRVIA